MSEARLLFLQGYADQPLAAAELGYRDAAAFPDLAWSFRILLAEAQVRKGQAGSAVQLLAEEPGIALPREVLWRRWLSRSYALCSASRYQEADGSFATAEHVQLPDPALESEFYLVKGRCDLIKREWATAAFWFNKAENSAQATQFTKMYARMGLGRAAMQSLNYEESERWYRRALEIEPGLAALPAQEATLGNLGFAYFELGEFSKALEHSRAAEELAGKIGLVQDRMSWLLDVGRAYDATGQYGFAQEYYNKALAIARQLGDQKIRAKALHNLVQIDLFHGKLASAEEHQSEARTLNTEGDDRLQFKRDEAGIAAAKSDWTRAEHLLLEVLPELKNSPRLTWMVQADLARVCVAQNKVQAADQWFQRGIATMEKAAASMRRTEFKIAMLGNWPIFDDYIAFLEGQKRPEQALQVAQMARARTLADQLGFKRQKEIANTWVRRIQAMLQARNAVLLAYYESEHATYLWAITPQRFLPLKLEVSSSELEALADSYAREIQEQRSPQESVAQQRLYQILVKPARELLPKGAHVALVADSSLYRINFESLISDEGALHYWIEDAELENASSIDLLLAGRGQRRKSKGLLLMGAPDQTSPDFPTLPHAGDEMASVQKQFQAAEVTSFSGAAATPEAYINANPGRAKYIEFATHGTANASDFMESTIVLSRGANGNFQLYARDIVKIKLNADLVSISACYGAGTFKTSSEGLLGLQWAFMRAGAHQVVAGLWDVNDASVPQLMGGLYEGVVKGRSASAALRAAKLKMLHTEGPQSAPYYWAPLQVYTGP